MSSFNYSKWDKIELSDDESDCHPNIEKESWFRMKHRSRVEREENEEVDKKSINHHNSKANQRISELNSRIAQGERNKAKDPDDDDLEDYDGMKAEIKVLQGEVKEREQKLVDYDKNRKWNVDNMSKVIDEKTYINPSAGTSEFSESGYALPAKAPTPSPAVKTGFLGGKKDVKKDESADTDSTTTAVATTNLKSATPAAGPITPAAAANAVATIGPETEKDAMLSYADFVTKYEQILEDFVNLEGMTALETFMITNGDILLQEHASSYLLLASLEDEMNGFRGKMKRTARNSQILTNVAELAKSLKRHPGNVIRPFFRRVEEEQYMKSFQEGVTIFVDRIIKRSIEKKKEMDADELETEEVDLNDLSLEERLGPGGLDPVEVFESLPKVLQEAFESRSVDALKEALMTLTPEEAQKHMERCEGAGLWNA